MRHTQPRLVDDSIAVEEQIEVDRPRTPPDAGITVSTQIALDREQVPEQVSRSEETRRRRVRSSLSCATARRIVGSRSPKLAPRPIYAVVVLSFWGLKRSFFRIGVILTAFAAAPAAGAFTHGRPQVDSRVG